MRKIVLILLLFAVVLSACQVSKYETKTLSDIQVTACNAANDAGTCDTRLPELGIVLKEDCCKSLGKCC